jgi:cytidylate kinase
MRGDDHRLVCISGLTGAGKTTLARYVAERFGYAYTSASSALLSVLGATEVSKANRLRSWLGEHMDSLPYTADDAAIDRAVDLQLLIQLEGQTCPYVVESLALPMLLPPLNTALTILLDVPQEVRAERLHRELPQVSAQDRATIIARKDAHSRRRLLGAWSIDLGSPAGNLRYDIVCQPTTTSTAEPFDEDCLLPLVEAAIAVYECRLARCKEDPVLVVNRLLATLRTCTHACTFISPVLTSPIGPHPIRRWRQRSLEHASVDRKHRK